MNSRIISKFEGRSGDDKIETQRSLSSVRNLRAEILKMAFALSREKGINRYLVLIDPVIKENRLLEEINFARNTFKQNIFERLHLVVSQSGELKFFSERPSEEKRSEIEERVDAESASAGIRIARPDKYFELVKILIYRMLYKRGPISSDELAKAGLCSYPTVAKAIERLGDYITRYSNKSIELIHFPSREWAKLLADSDRVRSTIRYTDKSGQSRQPESLIKRINKLNRDDIAIGGIPGAHFHYHDIDILGNPRADITIHGPSVKAGIKMIEEIDPALVETNDPKEPSNLVVHFINRQASFFQMDSEGFCWADPVECLLDLQEMRFEAQAVEFLNSF